ncbi:hypothetical protein U9M48_023336 [Paspalum notatum var. saurae]|uniref:Uncharacterized protein n=1 Tax=Paspalum notatum var. saurae TaxID=547442 RepID=A0AAQ3TK94_PASNO
MLIYSPPCRIWATAGMHREEAPHRWSRREKDGRASGPRGGEGHSGGGGAAASAVTVLREEDGGRTEEDEPHQRERRMGNTGAHPVVSAPPYHHVRTRPSAAEARDTLPSRLPFPPGRWQPPFSLRPERSMFLSGSAAVSSEEEAELGQPTLDGDRIRGLIGNLFMSGRSEHHRLPARRRQPALHTRLTLALSVGPCRRSEEIGTAIWFRLERYGDSLKKRTDIEFNLTAQGDQSSTTTTSTMSCIYCDKPTTTSSRAVKKQQNKRMTDENKKMIEENKTVFLEGNRVTSDGPEEGRRRRPNQKYNGSEWVK